MIDNGAKEVIFNEMKGNYAGIPSSACQYVAITSIITPEADINCRNSSSQTQDNLHAMHFEYEERPFAGVDRVFVAVQRVIC